jgi:hypothetical protein
MIDQDIEKVDTNASRQITSRSGSQRESKDDGKPLLNQELENTTDANNEDGDTVASPRKLSPITEGRVLNKSRNGSQHNQHGAAPRTRKQTIASITSEWTTTGSRANLANQLSRISVRSYAQSLSRLSQINPSNIGESMASVAISVREFYGKNSVCLELRSERIHTPTISKGCFLSRIYSKFKRV